MMAPFQEWPVNSQRARAAQVRVMGDPFMRRLKRFRQERNACIVSIVGNLLHDMPAWLRASIEPKNVKTGSMNECARACTSVRERAHRVCKEGGWET